MLFIGDEDGASTGVAQHECDLFGGERGVERNYDCPNEQGGEISNRPFAAILTQDGDTIATISKKWFRVRESYGVEINPGEDTALILAMTVALDDMNRG